MRECVRHMYVTAPQNLHGWVRVFVCRVVWIWSPAPIWRQLHHPAPTKTSPPDMDQPPAAGRQIPRRYLGPPGPFQAGPCPLLLLCEFKSFLMKKQIRHHSQENVPVLASYAINMHTPPTHPFPVS